MFFKILLYKLIGYIRINVEGFYIEKFINICRQNGIFLWGIKREKASIILFKARVLNNPLAFCYFNIRYYVKKGMHPAEAGAYIAELIQKMLEQRTSGLNLKI